MICVFALTGCPTPDVEVVERDDSVGEGLRIGVYEVTEYALLQGDFACDSEPIREPWHADFFDLAFEPGGADDVLLALPCSAPGLCDTEDSWLDEDLWRVGVVDANHAEGVRTLISGDTDRCDMRWTYTTLVATEDGVRGERWVEEAISFDRPCDGDTADTWTGQTVCTSIEALEGEFVE